MKIVLLYGGKSAEHDISIMSAFSILNAIYYDYYTVSTIYIDKKGSWNQGPILTSPPESINLLKDVDSFHPINPYEIKEKDTIVFPVLHGPNGEDGTIQGFLETLNLPYIGAGVLTSACAMDKIMTKYIMQQIGIPQVPHVSIMKATWESNPETIITQCEGSLIYPMFIKPSNMGSSVGITKATDQESLLSGIDFAFNYDSRVLVEQGIDAREIEIAVLGNDDVRTTLAGEIVKTTDFYDYDAKYVDNDVTLQIPAEIPEDVHNQARNYATQAYKAIDGSGLSRCDFFLTSNNELFLNEINTMPGFTPFSMYPLLWQEMGLKYGDLIEELIQLALLRFKERQQFSN